MQFEHATLSAGVGPLATGVGATGAARTPDVAAMRDDDRDTSERWRAWRTRGAKNDRETARTMKRIFVAILLALSIWLVFQLLS